MAEKVKDLVCGTKINKAAAATYTYNRETYYFCDLVCQWTFEEDPDRYLEKREDPLCGPSRLAERCDLMSV